ncbi:MAG: DNA polymerase III subunit chi [Sulfurimicrobium sp.]|nr:DNA polymerase III subunit chi [Sulfurimicrobium sp.]MDO9189692.1 DNA polymerase III subunit chi [Sulfurimicrobium sp.]MDP1705266.1 DNA polymerase III subunit chi [Sulfurimicrobium sp.]MDP2197617.1 DNA polymerase III subunit chi [Sulfurimicrobium sp.]MDP3688923.1 DNA polymerase III subunit chi [Sulfurimicrobium sp.]
MTQIDFYTHVQDKRLFACKLSAKALEQGLRVLVLTPDESDAARMDQMLWNVPATGFLPHCRARDELAPVTPVIVDHDPGELPHEQVLLNLSGTRPAFFSRFQRLIEIVTTDEADREAARERFRFYRDRGYEIRSHDMSQAGTRHS